MSEQKGGQGAGLELRPLWAHGAAARSAAAGPLQLGAAPAVLGRDQGCLGSKLLGRNRRVSREHASLTVVAGGLGGGPAAQLQVAPLGRRVFVERLSSLQGGRPAPPKEVPVGSNVLVSRSSRRRATAPALSPLAARLSAHR